MIQLITIYEYCANIYREHVRVLFGYKFCFGISMNKKKRKKNSIHIRRSLSLLFFIWFLFSLCFWVTRKENYFALHSSTLKVIKCFWQKATLKSNETWWTWYNLIFVIYTVHSTHKHSKQINLFRVNLKLSSVGFYVQIEWLNRKVAYNKTISQVIFEFCTENTVNVSTIFIWDVCSV